MKGLGGERSRGEKSRGEKAGVNRHVAIIYHNWEIARLVFSK